MSFKEKFKEEVRQVGIVTLYFLICFGMILLLKKLFLAEYNIEFFGLSAAIIGSLVVAKVVVILDHTTIGNRFDAHPVYVHVLYRSLIYSFFVGLVVLIEHTFEARHEAGGFMAGFIDVITHRNDDKFWATFIFIFLSFVGYNIISAINDHLGEGELRRFFFSRKTNHQLNPDVEKLD